tara:strand:+ start:505 stop:699 length:195 start_codon:yes stop_codon:yes gene_type:complete
MNEKYSDGQRSNKELLNKNKKNNRDIKRQVGRSSYDSSKDKLEDLDEWDQYEDLSFEKFRNGKR